MLRQTNGASKLAPQLLTHSADATMQNMQNINRTPTLTMLLPTRITCANTQSTHQLRRGINTGTHTRWTTRPRG
eukprot:11160411-Lingulodinium_polyedra.AAC.1